MKHWTKSMGLVGNTAGLILGAVTFASIPIESSLDYLWPNEQQPRLVGLAKIWLQWGRGVGAAGSIVSSGVGYVGRARKGDVSTPRWMPGPNAGDGPPDEPKVIRTRQSIGLERMQAIVRNQKVGAQAKAELREELRQKKSKVNKEFLI